METGYTNRIIKLVSRRTLARGMTMTSGTVALKSNHRAIENRLNRKAGKLVASASASINLK